MSIKAFLGLLFAKFIVLKNNGWKNSSKKPVKNKDLWVKLDNLCQKNKITWKWVKGHSTNKYNNLADELATQAIKN